MAASHRQPHPAGGHLLARLAVRRQPRSPARGAAGHDPRPDHHRQRDAVHLSTGWAAFVDVGPQGLPFIVDGSRHLRYLADVPWLSASPIAGTIAPAGSQPVNVTFDSTGLAIGRSTRPPSASSRNDPDEPIVPSRSPWTVSHPGRAPELQRRVDSQPGGGLRPAALPSPPPSPGGGFFPGARPEIRSAILPAGLSAEAAEDTRDSQLDWQTASGIGFAALHGGPWSCLVVGRRWWVGVSTTHGGSLRSREPRPPRCGFEASCIEEQRLGKERRVSRHVTQERSPRTGDTGSLDGAAAARRGGAGARGAGRSGGPGGQASRPAAGKGAAQRDARAARSTSRPAAKPWPPAMAGARPPVPTPRSPAGRRHHLLRRHQLQQHRPPLHLHLQRDGLHRDQHQLQRLHRHGRDRHQLLHANQQRHQQQRDRRPGRGPADQPADSEIRYETLGTTPNQVFVDPVEELPPYGATGDIYNYQIRLYETSNLVEVVYGAFTQNATARTSQVGLRGASNTDFNNRTSTGAWTASTAGAINTATMALTAAYYPPVRPDLGLDGDPALPELRHLLQDRPGAGGRGRPDRLRRPHRQLGHRRRQRGDHGRPDPGRHHLQRRT